jgi:hypothetical protein
MAAVPDTYFTRSHGKHISHQLILPLKRPKFCRSGPASRRRPRQASDGRPAPPTRWSGTLWRGLRGVVLGHAGVVARRARSGHYAPASQLAKLTRSVA